MYNIIFKNKFKSHLCQCLLKLKPFTCVDLKKNGSSCIYTTSFGLVLKLLFETKKFLVQVLLPSIHFLIGF